MANERSRRSSAALAASLALTWSVASAAQSADDRATAKLPDLVLVADPKLGLDGGARTMDSVSRIFFEYERAWPRFADGPGATRGERAIDGVSRGVRAVAVDTPLATFLSTLTHEVYGHGGRARELGFDATYSFTLPVPYNIVFTPHETRASGETHVIRPGPSDRETAITSGGIEANYEMARRTNWNIVAAGGWVHYGTMWRYMADKASYIDSFFQAAPNTRSDGNDVLNYVADLQDRFNRPTDTDRKSIGRRLSTAYVWNLIDPTLVYSFYAVIRTIATGDPYSRAPLPSVRGTQFLPTPRFSLTPFGPEQGIDVFVHRGALTMDLYGKVGVSGLASASGGGVAFDGIEAANGKLRFGAELHAWRQPELMLDARNAYDRDNRLGGAGAAQATWRIEGPLGLVGKLGYKSRGYLSAQPLDQGPFGYVGIAITPEGWLTPR